MVLTMWLAESLAARSPHHATKHERYATKIPLLWSRCNVSLGRLPRLRQFRLQCSRTDPPVREQREQVEDADRAVAVEVGRVPGVGSPRRQQREQVEDADVA